MKLSNYALLLFAHLLIGCETRTSDNKTDGADKSAEQLPYLTFQKEQFFPGDGSLSRPEDGVAFADGRVIVVDQAKGLRVIEKDGSNRPFGKFGEVGFIHNPPEFVAGPNGLFLEHDKQHLLMCDIGDGKIYRINIASEKVELVYDHPFGVNAIYRDKTGAIWFTQSGKNTDMGGLFTELDLPLPNGAVLRLPDLKSKPKIIVDSLCFANGITMTPDEKTLFVSECMMNRVLSFDVDISNGETKQSGIAATVLTPDNIIVDTKGRLFIASPATNKIVAVDFKNHSQHLIFDASTKETQKLADEWFRRSQLGIGRSDLVTPQLHSPLPALLTGMFFSHDGKTLFIANLGNDILKLDFR